MIFAVYTCISRLELEEEKDTLKAKFLRSQSCISELRTQLQHEKNGEFSVHVCVMCHVSIL